MKWRDANGKEQVLKLHEKMSTKWFELGQNVGASDAMLSNLRKSPDEDEAHMNKVTQAWIRKGKNQKVVYVLSYNVGEIHKTSPCFVASPHME